MVFSLLDCAIKASDDIKAYPPLDPTPPRCMGGACSEARTHYVYELLVAGELVYVGCTIDVNQRLRSHCAARKRRDIELGNVVKCCCITIGTDLERKAILWLRPPWNKMPGRPRSK